jgi:hypothetical protein
LCVLTGISGCAEICSVANGASKKEIGRATKFIVKQLEEDMGVSMEMGTIHAGDFLVGLVYAPFFLLCNCQNYIYLLEYISYTLLYVHSIMFCLIFPPNATEEILLAS